MNNEMSPEKKKFLKIIAGFLAILAIFLVVRIIADFKSLPYIGQDVINRNVITVNGVGDVFAVPDTATFSFSVIETDKTVASAQEKVTNRMNIALAAVKSLDVDEKDIKTTDYSVYPKYEYTSFLCNQYSCPPRTQILTGYEVSQGVSIKVRKVADSGKILGEVGKLNVSNVSGLQFVIDDPDALTAEARSKAIDDAKAKAVELSRQLGVSLGRVINFSESGNQPVYFAKSEMAYGVGGAVTNAPTPEVPAGQNKITSHVSITYEIK